MSDKENLTPETEYDEALEEVEELGGDPEIIKSLPNDDDLLLPSEPPPPADSLDPLAIDIEAALASVSELSDLLAEREVAEQAKEDRRTERQQERAAPKIARLPAPPPMILKRGQPASVIPALVLMAVGAWLTLAFTAPESVPFSPAMLLPVLGGALVAILIAHWLTSGRWSRGLLFFALLAALSSGAVYAGSLNLAPFPLTAPLLLAAVGLALAFTGFLARPAERRLIIPGGLLLLAAVVGVVLAMNVIPADTISRLTPYLPLVIVLLLVMWALPVAGKRLRRGA